ncbi:DUF416 family protein [Pedobacter sp. GSP4]|uniref:DUF416 family protein n=1 Tax=Pedobacter sp. GSP4 TaxID=3453716 RepID=UPI003EEB6AA7
MDSTQFYERLSNQLTPLSQNRRIAFGLDICERILVDYVDFYNEYQWGNPAILKEAITYCSSSISAGADEERVKQLLTAIEDVLPDTEEFTEPSGTYALNAGCAVFELLEYLNDPEVDHLLNISSALTDTINFKLGEAEPDLTDEELLQQPVMVNEWNYQLEISK